MGILSDLGIDEARLTDLARILERNKMWLYNNYDELREKYGGSFVAVYKRKIVLSHKDQNELWRLIHEQFQDSDIDEIIIEFINSKKVNLFL